MEITDQKRRDKALRDYICSVLDITYQQFDNLDLDKTEKKAFIKILKDDLKSRAERIL